MPYGIIKNKFPLNKYITIDGISSKASRIDVVRQAKGIRINTKVFKHLFTFKQIGCSLGELKSFFNKKNVEGIRIGHVAESFRYIKNPKEKVDGIVRLCGSEKYINTMQGNFFAAILVHAGLGEVKDRPMKFYPNKKFFEVNIDEKIILPESKIKRIWNAINNRVEKKKFKGKFFISYEQFRTWYLSQYKKIPVCYYCGIPEPLIETVFWEGRKTKRPKTRTKLEIDRIDSSLTYNAKNCVLACMVCNNAKSDVFTADEFKPIGRIIESIWKKDVKR